MIQALREALRADLEGAQVKVYIGWAERVSVPCVVVVPPVTAYITGGQFVGSYTLALDLYLLVRSGVGNSLSTLESLIETVLIHTVDWGLSGVDGPGTLSISGADYFGTIVHLTKQGKI
jgi:hypothetical protein